MEASNDTISTGTQRNGFASIYTFVDNAHAQPFIFIICALAAQLIFPGATLPFVFLTVSLLTTKIVVHFKDIIPQIPLKDLVNKASQVNKKRPEIQIICVICSVALCVISPYVSLAVSIGSGMYLGLLSKNQNNRHYVALPSNQHKIGM